LEGYAWNIRRITEGYNEILIDEYHLFNDTERYLLHLLTNDPDIYLKLVLSVDPAQSPFALLAGLDHKQLSRLASTTGFNVEVDLVELSTIHRFTRNIHRFVNHIYGSLPNLVGLGSDWTYDVSSLPSGDGDGALVKVRFADDPEVVPVAVEIAQQKKAQMPRGARIAVLGVTLTDLAEMRSYIESKGISRHFTTMSSREDVDRLAYSQKTIVLASAEYAAGLQFDTIVIVSAVNPEGNIKSASATRAAISQLYLAATRSKSALYCVSTSSDTIVSNVLRTAVDAGVADH
jgi:hypothetical protein